MFSRLFSFFLYHTVSRFFLHTLKKLRSSFGIVAVTFIFASLTTANAYAGWNFFFSFDPLNHTEEEVAQVCETYIEHTVLYSQVRSNRHVFDDEELFQVLGDYFCFLFRVDYPGESPCPFGYAYNQETQQCAIAPPDQMAENYGAGPNLTCNPINIATGGKFFRQQEFRGRGVDPLSFSLYYNSQRSDQVWTFDYRQSLRAVFDTVQAHRPDGQVITFTRDSNDRLQAAAQRIETLTFDGNEYQLALADNTLETYNSSGKLQSIQFPSGITHHLSYQENIVTVTRNNESMTLEMEIDRRDALLQGIGLPDGTDVRYSYTSDANTRAYLLTQATYPDLSSNKPRRTYHYGNSNYRSAITAITDENGHRISSVIYDELGRAISSEVGSLNSGIDRTQITYHDDGSRTLTNALGKQNTYHFTDFNGEFKMTQVEGHASENCAAANQSYTYDANGFMASKTDWKGNTTTYINNGRGLEISRTEASGTPDARTITTEWHPTFNLRTRITEPDRITVLTYDDQGRMISQEVSPR